MPIYDAQSIPEKVYSSTKDPEIAEWLKTAPVLGAHKAIHIQRREHDAFIDEVNRSARSSTLASAARTAQSRFESVTPPNPARPRAVH